MLMGWPSTGSYICFKREYNYSQGISILNTIKIKMERYSLPNKPHSQYLSTPPPHAWDPSQPLFFCLNPRQVEKARRVSGISSSVFPLFHHFRTLVMSTAARIWTSYGWRRNYLPRSWTGQLSRNRSYLCYFEESPRLPSPVGRHNPWANPSRLFLPDRC